MYLGYIVLAVATLSACTAIQCGGSKAQFLETYERFMDEVDDTDMRITDTRWKVYDNRLKMYIVDCYASYEEEMAYADKQEILSRAIKYYYKRYGSDMIREIQNEDNPTSVAIKEEMTELWEHPDQILREIAGDDWEQMVDDFLNDLEKWKSRLQKILEGDQQ